MDTERKRWRALPLLLAVPLLGWSNQDAPAPGQEPPPRLARMISQVDRIPGTIPIPVVDAAIVDIGPRTILLGGMTGNFQATPAIQLRRPDGTWQPVGNQMLNPRIAPDAIPLPDGRIFVWGGASGSARETLTTRLDGELLNPRIAGSATLVTPPADSGWLAPSRPCLLPDGTIAIAAEDGIHRYDPTEGSWSPPITIGRPLDQPALCHLGGMRLLLIDSDPDLHEARVLEVDCTNGSFDQWQERLPHPVPGCSLFLLPNGHVVVSTWFDQDGRRTSGILLLSLEDRSVERALLPAEVETTPNWITTCPNDADLLILMTTRASGENQALAFLLTGPGDASMKTWQLSTPPPGRLQMVRTSGQGRFELLGGYRFLNAREAREERLPEGATISTAIFQLKYGTGPIGD